MAIETSEGQKIEFPESVEQLLIDICETLHELSYDIRCLKGYDPANNPDTVYQLTSLGRQYLNAERNAGRYAEWERKERYGIEPK